MARAAKLKVYQAQLGFHDIVVAAPNQRAALQVLDISQDLFREGMARVATDPQAIEAALAHPGVPLRRPVGTDKPFGLTAGFPELPAASKTAAQPRKKAPAKPPPPPPPPPPPDRGPLTAAEAELAEVEAQEQREAAALRRRRQELEAEEAAAQRRWARQREAADRKLDTARRAYLKAGGRP